MNHMQDFGADMALINQLAKAELTEDQVYAFTVRLCDNETDGQDLPDGGGAGGCCDDCCRRWILLAQGVGLFAADGEERGPDC